MGCFPRAVEDARPYGFYASRMEDVGGDAHIAPHSRVSGKAPLCKGRFPPIAGENVGVADQKGAVSRQAKLSA